MSHQAYARKYRPNTFDEIIDQAHIATTIKNAIAQDNIAHAYLFAGPRGIGKTSTARILAKALNCVSGPTVMPCNTCSSCVEIREGRSMDVMEIDGASNRGIDEIRALRESVKFSPTSGRYKVYIIDEVHMLTTEAFNALLKTLEEPPAHVKFIFATTEPHRVLPTILSRCQRFDFHKISTPGIVAKLKKMAGAEKIKVDEDALYAIARNAEGSLRDAEVVLDQLNSFSRGKVTLAGADILLGLVSRDILFRLVAQLVPERLADNLVLIDTFVKEGKDPMQVIHALLEHFRSMMLVKAGAGSLVELSAEDIQRVQQQSAEFTQDRILYSLAVLVQTQERIKRQGMGRLLLEMAVLKLSEPAQDIPANQILASLDRIEQQMSESPRAVTPTCAAELPVRENKISEQAARSYSSPSSGESIGPAEEPQACQQLGVMDRPVSDIQLAEVIKKWPQFVRALRKEKVFLAECLSAGRPVALRGQAVEVSFPAANEFQREHVMEPAHVKVIETAAIGLFGVGMKIVAKCGEVVSPEPPVQPEEELLAPSGAAEESVPVEDEESSFQDFVQSAMDVFNGRIVSHDE